MHVLGFGGDLYFGRLSPAKEDPAELEPATPLTPSSRAAALRPSGDDELMPTSELSWREQCTLAVKLATESKVSAGQITPEEAAAILAKHKKLLGAAEREQDQGQGASPAGGPPAADDSPASSWSSCENGSALDNSAASSPQCATGGHGRPDSPMLLRASCESRRSNSGDELDPRIATALNVYTDLINAYNDAQRVQSAQSSAEQHALDEVRHRVESLTQAVATYEAQLSPLEDAKSKVRGLMEDGEVADAEFRTASHAVAELTRELGDVLMALRTTEADLKSLSHEQESIHGRRAERKSRLRALKTEVDHHFRRIEELSMELHAKRRALSSEQEA